jgi:hypothetical protein
MPITVDEIVVADPPALWESLGFRVEGSSCDIGIVRVQLDPDAGKRIAEWSLRGIETTDLDGLPTIRSDSGPRAAAGQHPNGVTNVDHVVAFSPDLDRTVERLQAAGLDLRRIREEPTPAGAPRQAFFRLGEVILECVQMPDSPDLDRSRNASFFGLALQTMDLALTQAVLGTRLGSPRPAVQEGRTIATLGREAGSSIAIAFMTPPPRRSASQPE